MRRITHSHIHRFARACLQAIRTAPACTQAAAWRHAVLLSVLTSATFAQSVRWDPPGGQLGFNQVSQISLVFENCEPDGELRLPRVDGLDFGEPSRSSETSIVNFKMTQTFSFVFPVRPTRRTSLTIPSFEVKTDKGSVRVPAASFSVGDAPVGSSGLSINDVATARLSTPQSSYWAGEVFPVTYNLEVVRRYFHSLASNLDWPSAPLVGEDWTKPDPGETLLRGERRVVSVQTTRAYARQPGKYTIKPATQMVNLMVGTSGFGFFAQPAVEQRQLESSPLQVTINPLPPGPADFSGTVGEFAFKSKVVPTAAAVGEPVTWTLELSGRGNWPDITGMPQRDVSNDFQVVQPKSKRTMKDGALFEGTLSEDVVLVPTRPGTYKLAPVRFTYFDTKSGTYKAIASEPVTITVTATAAPTQPAAGSGAPVQFSLNAPTAGSPAAAVLPTAVPPVAPENLPRDPIAASAAGFVPLGMRPLAIACILAVVLCPLFLWLALAALRSRELDPQRRRREARAKLAAILAEIRNASQGPGGGYPASQLPALNALLRRWQEHAADLWEVAHAAPGSPLLQASVGLRERDAAPAWAGLWLEADRALHGRAWELPADWISRAESALQAVRVPGWPPHSLFAPRHLLPFLFALAVVLAPATLRADEAADAYKRGNFDAAEAAWSKSVAGAPADWTARHNLGLALSQQNRWAEATAHWTSAFLLNSRSGTTRWDLALGLQQSGMAPSELVEFSRGEGRYKVARFATAGEWQLALVGAALLLAAALVILLLQGYRRIGAWAKPAALAASLVAMSLAVTCTLSLRTYGQLANPSAVLVWKASVLRSIPTEADTSQKTSPLSAGSIAVAEKSFLGWTKLVFPGGQSGWARTADLIALYR